MGEPLAQWGGSGALRGGGLGSPAPPHSPLLTDTVGATLPHVALELEVRPQTATSLIFHLGRVQKPPYLQLQVLAKQVSCGQGGCGHRWDWGSQGPPDLCPPLQVLLRADDGAGEFSTWVTCPAALCDGQWHRLAGEPAPPPPLLF